MTEAMALLLRVARKDPEFAKIAHALFGHLGPKHMLAGDRELVALHHYAERIINRSEMRQQLARGPEPVGAARVSGEPVKA